MAEDDKMKAKIEAVKREFGVDFAEHPSGLLVAKEHQRPDELLPLLLELTRVKETPSEPARRLRTNHPLRSGRKPRRPRR